MSATATHTSSPIDHASTTCSAIADEASDLAAFLAAAGDDLPPDLAVEVAALLDGVRQVLQGITAKIGEAGPG